MQYRVAKHLIKGIEVHFVEIIDPNLTDPNFPSILDDLIDKHDPYRRCVVIRLNDFETYSEDGPRILLSNVYTLPFSEMEWAEDSL